MSRLVVDVRWLGLVESFLGRARTKLEEAEFHMKEGHYPESVSASQECIEFSAKSVCKILTGDYPREHWFQPEELWRVLMLIPGELKDLAYSGLCRK